MGPQERFLFLVIFFFFYLLLHLEGGRRQGRSVYFFLSLSLFLILRGGSPKDILPLHTYKRFPPNGLQMPCSERNLSLEEGNREERENTAKGVNINEGEQIETLLLFLVLHHEVFLCGRSL